VEAYLGICLVMAVSPRNKLRDHWSVDPALNNPFISSVMSLKRFLRISESCNSSTQDKCKLQDLPIIASYRASIRNAYNLHRDCVILDVTQSLRHKEKTGEDHRWEALVLKDGVTGYIKDVCVSPTGSGLDQITSGLQPHQCVYLGRGLATVELCSELKGRRKVYSCGELNPDAAERILKSKTWPTNHRRGSISSFQSGPCAVYTWQGHERMATVVSTMNRATSDSDRRRGEVTSHGNQCPASLSRHTQLMRVHAGFRKFHSTRQTSHSLWKQLLWFALDVALNNAHVVWKECNKPELTSRAFILKVGKELVGAYRRPVKEQLLLPAEHVCVRVSHRARMCRQCKMDGTTTEGGRRRETIYGCGACGVTLCRDGCFLKYHTMGH